MTSLMLVEHSLELRKIFDFSIGSIKVYCVQSNLDRLLHGFSSIGLRINSSKCEFLVFNCSYPVSLSIGTFAISCVDSFIYLGARFGCTVRQRQFVVKSGKFSVYLGFSRTKSG